MFEFQAPLRAPFVFLHGYLALETPDYPSSPLRASFRAAPTAPVIADRCLRAAPGRDVASYVSTKISMTPLVAFMSPQIC